MVHINRTPRFYKVTDEGLCPTQTYLGLSETWGWESIATYFLVNSTAKFSTRLIWTVLTDDEYFLERI